MTVKQIYMPVSAKSTQIEMMFSPEEIQKRYKQMNERVLKGERELNDALNDGYSITAQYPSDDQNEVGIVFVMYKFVFEEANRKLYEDKTDAEEYLYPAGPNDTPHCKTCGADILYCRCDRQKS